MTHGIIYTLCYKDHDGSERIFYVGRTRKTLEARLAEHRKGARDPLNPKAAYEFIRASNLVDEFYALEVCKEGELTEADVVRAATLEGHTILNATVGDSVVPKKRQPSTFAALNREALARTAEPRRNLLHGEKQTLSKPEIVRQRITGDLPDAESLNGMHWTNEPPELLPWGKVPKITDDLICERLRLGDFLIYVVRRKGQWAYWVKNTRTSKADAYKVNWCKCRAGFTRLDALNHIVERFPSFIWWPLSARNDF